MDRAHWGLSGTPFRVAAGETPFYTSPGGEEALARLQFLVEEQRRLGILLGCGGGGKSTLLTQLTAQARRRGAAVALVALAGLGSHELLWQVAADLGANPEADEERFRVWRRLCDRLTELRYEQVPIVLLLDDADRAPAETLATIERLVGFGPAVDTPLTIVLTANVATSSLLGERLVEAADLRVELSPWSETDTADYVRAALEETESDTGVFAAEAVARLHELSGGLPRRINQLADFSLLAGAAQEARQIDAATVEAVFDELGFAATSTDYDRAYGN